MSGRRITDAEVEAREQTEAKVERHRALMRRADEMGVTLDGKPAIVRGARLPFAKVGYLNGPAVEFSWEAVERVLDGGGQFKL